MIRASLLAIASLVSACSSSADPSGPCVARHGTYLESFSETSGNCGVIQNFVVIVPPLTDAGAGCSASGVASTDNCTVTIQATCPNNTAAAPNTALTEQGDVHWATDGSSAHGTLEISLVGSTGVEICDGTYNVTFQRQ